MTTYMSDKLALKVIPEKQHVGLNKRPLKVHFSEIIIFWVHFVKNTSSHF
jgi:hypothetical protein